MQRNKVYLAMEPLAVGGSWSWKKDAGHTKAFIRANGLQELLRSVNAVILASDIIDGYSAARVDDAIARMKNAYKKL